MAEAARIALTTTAEWLAEHDLPERVRFVLFGQQAYSTWKRVYDDLLAGRT